MTMTSAWIASTGNSSSKSNYWTTTQSLLAVGALIATTASIYIVSTRHRARPTKTDDDIYDGDTSSSPSSTDNAQLLPSHIQREIYKLRQRKSKIPLISMKKPMYDNVYMLDQERELLCTISMKKARWYINKGIAEWSTFQNGTTTANIGNDAKCIRLLFAHSGRNRQRPSSNNTSIEQQTTTTTSSERLYLCSTKRNICVSCGKSDHHIRHYIVPYAYRTLLPKQYKSHMSHDIVILCPECHLDCERLTKRRMKDMEHELRMNDMRRKSEENDDIGLAYYNTIDPVIDDPKLGQVRSCALALLKWKATMPQEQVERYEMIVRTYLASNVCTDDEEKKLTILNRTGGMELTKLQLQHAINVKYRTKNPNYIPGAEIVIQSLNGEDRRIELFIREWRTFFIKTVHPQHMPLGWKVDNPVVCGSRDTDDDENDDDDERVGGDNDSRGVVKTW